MDGAAVGDRRQVFDAREGQWINLPAARWSAEIDVGGKAQIVVRFQGKDQDLFWDDDLGTVGYTLRPPWAERSFRASTEYFLLEWGVELLVEGRFGHHAPSEVFACRASAGNLACSTVSGVPITARMEIHPVRPVPTAAMPPRGLPAGAPLSVENNVGATISPGDPINTVPNPAVIPILAAPGGAAPAAGAPPQADATNAARIEVTYYRPNTLAFTDHDNRLEWSARPLAGGAVSFLGPARGLKVMVYGTAAGEVLLEVRFRGELFATYRALVMAVKHIPCRVNILNGPTPRSQPRSTPANVQDHLAIANRYLRQIALELVLDTNPTVTDGAHATGTPGIFRIRVAAGLTRNIDSDLTLATTRLNYRHNVMNFAYVHSERHASILGAATDFPSSLAPAAPGARPVVTDTGSPSSSWISPTGVAPDAAAGPITMQLIKGMPRHGHPHLVAMFVADTHGDPTVLAIQQNYANTMAHELLHILNLGHRVEGPDATTPTGLAVNGIFWDGLLHPPDQNVMHWNAPGNIAQDLDIIQARGAHRSPLVPP